MKKLFIIATLVASLSLVSCGKKSAADYQKEAMELAQEYVQAQMSGDTEKADKLMEKAEKLSEEVQKRMKDDPEFAKEYQSLPIPSMGF